MIKHIAAGLVALSLAGTAGAEAPTEKELRQTSWGKPGVSLEDYRVDAGVCAWRATNMDIAGTEPAKTMVKASRALGHEGLALMSYTTSEGQHQVVGAAIGMRNVVDRYRVDKQIDAVADMQYDALFGCLESRGYRRFQLTDEQARRLRKFKRGSLERHVYLHRLASDAEVVTRQAL